MWTFDWTIGLHRPHILYILWQYEAHIYYDTGDTAQGMRIIVCLSRDTHIYRYVCVCVCVCVQSWKCTCKSLAGQTLQQAKWIQDIPKRQTVIWRYRETSAKMNFSPGIYHHFITRHNPKDKRKGAIARPFIVQCSVLQPNPIFS